MGIKNLNNFISKHALQSMEEVDISDLSGSTVAIDTSIFLYKFMYSLKFIDNFIQQVFHFRKFNIQPIYVFDGAPPKEKQETLNNRKEQKEKLYLKIEEIQSKIKTAREKKEDIKLLQKELAVMKKKNIVITREDIITLKSVFDILGVQYIQCDCEADLVCCELYKTKKVDACMSNDMDFLPSGCGKLIRNYNLSNKITVYDLEHLLTLINFNYDQFVDFCILCGCDYTGKIQGLGSETAYKFLKQGDNIETILEKYVGEGKKYSQPENFEFQKSRELLKNEGKVVEFSIQNQNINKKELSHISPEEILFMLTKTRYTDKQLQNKLKIICSSETQ